MPDTSSPNWSEVLGWGCCEYDAQGFPFLYYGARAIFHPPNPIGRDPVTGEITRAHASLEYPGDRRTWTGLLLLDYGQERGKRSRHFVRFFDWLYLQALPDLEVWLDTAGQDDRYVWDDPENGLHLRASCRNSGGFCFIAAWMDRPSGYVSPTPPA